MNKLAFLLILLGLLTRPAMSQSSYLPLLGQSTEWLVKSCYDSSNCFYDYYIARGDTSLNGLNYTILNYYHFNKNFYLREDSLQQRVYFRHYSSDPNEPEFLLYDFSLLPGDTINIENPYSPGAVGAGLYQLDSIDSQNFEGIMRRVFYLSARDTSSIYPFTRWIEGIGSTALINTPGVNGNSLQLAELQCVHRNGQKIYQPPQSDSCYTATANFAVSRLELPTLAYRPDGSIYFESLPAGCELQLYDSSGRLIEHFRPVEPSGEIKTPYLKRGVYILQAHGKTGQVLNSCLMLKN